MSTTASLHKNKHTARHQLKLVSRSMKRESSQEIKPKSAISSPTSILRVLRQRLDQLPNAWKIFLPLLLLLPLVLTVVHATPYSWTHDNDTEFNYGTTNNTSISSGVSLNSAQVSDKLSGTSINDTYIYEPDRETSTAYVPGTSVYHDANWRNGISKLHTQIGGAAYSADPTVNPSSNIHVSGVQSTASDKLRIKVTTAGTVGTAQYQYSTDDGSTWNGSNITTSTSLTQIGSTGVYLQFEESSSYTLNDVFKIDSWFVETLGTATRGSTRAFPKKAILVATDQNLYIYDAKDNSLWMRFNADTGGQIDMVQSNVGNPSSVFARNGKLYVGQTNGSTNGILTAINFSEDKANKYYDVGYYVYNSNILERNSGDGNSVISGPKIVNKLVNDVHAAVISGKTYVAVATDGGVSVINEHDETVVDFTQTSYPYTKNIWLANTGDLYFSFNTTSATDRYLCAFYKENSYWSTGSSSYLSHLDRLYWYGGEPSLRNVGNGTRIQDIFITEETSVVDGSSNTIYVAGGYTSGQQPGLAIIQEKQGDESNGSVKYYTKDYITEELVGDIRGMYGFWDEDGDSTLANGDTISDLSVKDTDMTVVDGGGTAPQIVNGVRGKAIQFDGSNDYLKQKVYEDETGANWGPTYHGLSLADGAAFVRTDNVDLSPYASTVNNYMIVMEDTEGDVAWGYMDVADGAEALGSDLFDAGAGTFESGTYSWTAYGSNTIENDSNTLKITYVDVSTGAWVYIRDSADLSSDLTVQKLYKLTFDAKVGSGDSVNFRVVTAGMGSTPSVTVTETDFTSKTIYFTATSATGMQIRMSGMGASEIIWLDNLVLKEVTDVGTDGVHIMSTKDGSTQNWASVSGDFDYNDSSYTFEVRKTDFQITGDLTLGAWVKRSGTGSVDGIITKVGDLRSSHQLFFDNDDTLKWRVSSGASWKQLNPVTTYTSTTEWYYIVGVFNASTQNLHLFVNASEVGTLDTGVSSIDDGDGPCRIGVANTAGTSPIDGTIDEPFITAEALSSDQILDMFEKGCRAMGGTPGSGTCTGIDESSTTNTLAGSSNVVKGVSVDGSSSYAWVGTNDGSDNGALSKIQLNSDLLSC